MRLWIPCLLVVALAGCEHQDAPPMLSTPPPGPTPNAPDTRPTVAFTTGSGEAIVHVEVVSSQAQLERGLMYRQHLPPDDGMLFLMHEEKDWKFWMRNTLIPLDIIFVTKDMTVAGIGANAKPLDESLVSAGNGKLSTFVVETNAGWCQAHGVVAGAAVTFAGVHDTGG